MHNAHFYLELLELTQRTALILGVAWLAVVVAMAIDLVAGVRKARTAGIARTSYGYRRTIDKLGRYGTGLLFTLIADAVMLVGGVYSTPFASALLSVALVLIEAKSWFEKLEAKERNSIQDSLSTIAKTLNTRQADTLINNLTQTPNVKHDTTLHPQGANAQPNGTPQGHTQHPRPKRTRSARASSTADTRTPEAGAGQTN